MELIKYVKVLCLSIVLLMLFASPALAQEIEWIDQYGTSLFDGSFDIKADSTGLYATGGTEGNMGAAPIGLYDGFVRKFDAQGNDIWIRQFVMGKKYLQGTVTVYSCRPMKARTGHSC